ncbi:AAA family ATPase [Sorangium sp. So ce295]|uniref:AAA family ATPase n=1 Tax=Sorangium sp. So ce295 TaxID=3133295 RepID=UPI003F6001CD
MLRSLHLEGVGPADQLDLGLGERLNVLTGDNGLGKSFVLEVAWWALTGTWTERPVLPQPGKEASARISGEAKPGTEFEQFESKYDRVAQQWRDRFGRDMGRSWTNTPSGVVISSWVRGLVPVLHVRTNGACSVWDPCRNIPSMGSALYRLSSSPSPDPQPYLFEERQLWDGLVHEGKPVCNGLVQDWVTWQLEAADNDGAHPFELLCRVLDQLSHPEETMKPGKPVRLYLDDVRKFPTVELPYGTIPIIHASAGMKRILALSYLIAWSWSEHVQASRLIGWQRSERIVVLIEEPETHLHPRWQRQIVPALLGALSGLSPGRSAATRSGGSRPRCSAWSRRARSRRSGPLRLQRRSCAARPALCRTGSGPRRRSIGSSCTSCRIRIASGRAGSCAGSGRAHDPVRAHA